MVNRSRPRIDPCGTLFLDVGPTWLLIFHPDSLPSPMHAEQGYVTMWLNKKYPHIPSPPSRLCPTLAWNVNPYLCTAVACSKIVDSHSPIWEMSPSVPLVQQCILLVWIWRGWAKTENVVQYTRLCCDFHIVGITAYAMLVCLTDYMGASLVLG